MNNFVHVGLIFKLFAATFLEISITNHHYILWILARPNAVYKKECCVLFSFVGVR